MVLQILLRKRPGIVLAKNRGAVDDQIRQPPEMHHNPIDQRFRGSFVEKILLETGPFTFRFFERIHQPVVGIGIRIAMERQRKTRFGQPLGNRGAHALHAAGNQRQRRAHRLLRLSVIPICSPFSEISSLTIFTVTRNMFWSCRNRVSMI